MNKKMFLLMFGMIFLFGILSTMPSVKAFDWTDGTVVGYYKLDESSGTVIDATGNGYDGTNNGATSGVTGKINTAYEFNGTGYINASGGNISGNLTINAWIKYSNASGSNERMVCILAGASASNKGICIASAPTVSSGKINVLYESIAWGTADKDIADNNWHMVTLVYDGSSTSNIYIDANTTASATLSATPSLESKTYIGGQYGGTYTEYNGTVDEVGIWSRILSSSEISEIYNSGSGLPYGYEGGRGSVDLLSPSNDSIVSSTGTNFIANFTISGTNVENYTWKNATYFVWHDNGTLLNSTSVSLPSVNQTNYSLFINSFELGNYLWDVYGCYGNATYNNCTWSSNGNFTFEFLPFSEISYSFNESVLETSGQRYILNISAIEDVTSIVASFIYNGTSYSSTISDLGSGNYKISNGFDVPLNNGTTNKSFYWTFNFTLADSSTFLSNSSMYSQQVNETILTFCNATYSTQFVNFTSHSAENPFPIVNATFKSAWEWYVKGGSGSVLKEYNFEDVTEANSSWAFCGNYNDTFVTTSQVEYDGTDYALNSYFLEEAELTNTTNFIDIYLLNNSKATATTLLVREDQNQKAIEDALIQIQLYDVGTGSFYTVGMARTSYTGEDLAYLNWYDSLYKFIITKNGELLKITNTTRILETPQIFDIETTTTFSYDKFRDFQYSLTYNPSTKNFVLTFTKPSGLVDEGCLRVIKRTPKNDTLISLTCESSSSATLYSNIGSYGNGTFIATFYATGSWSLIDVLSQKIGGGFAESIYESLSSSDRLFYSFLFGLIVVVMFIVSPALGIIGAILGMLGSAALGFSLLDYTTFFGIAIVGGLVIWILKR